MTDSPAKQDAQPTPGPWRVDEKAKNEASVSVRGADNWAICACRATAPDGSRYHMNVARANARLIVAAVNAYRVNPATAAERDKLKGELQRVDNLLARRPALDDKLTRIDKILHALETAAERDRLKAANAELAAALVASAAYFAHADSKLGKQQRAAVKLTLPEPGA